MRKAIVGTVAAVALAGVVFAAYQAGRGAGARTAPTPAAAPGAKAAPAGIHVEATRVAVVSAPQAITAVGSLRSDETVIVRPEIAGRIAQILFREGERVQRGAALVKLDDSVQLADLAKARANLTLSKTKYERSIDLRKRGFLSSQARDEAENVYKVAQADVELMQARIAKTTIHAPFSGTVGLRVVSVGDYVKEGQDMVNLESLDPLKVDFRVPELALSRVRDGQTLQVSLDALPDQVYDGRVAAINPLIDANGRSIVIRAQVPNRDGKLRPGMFARVRLFTSASQDTMVVPEESLFTVGDDKYVYKVVDGRAVRQKVEIGARRAGRVEVTGGLAPGDMVVTAGALKLRDGAAVQVGASPAPTQTKPVLNTTVPRTRG